MQCFKQTKAKGPVCLTILPIAGRVMSREWIMFRSGMIGSELAGLGKMNVDICNTEYMQLYQQSLTNYSKN